MIKLKNRVSSNTTIKIETREFMEYLIAVADSKKILEDPIIKNNRELLWKMVSADRLVNIFDELT